MDSRLSDGPGFLSDASSIKVLFLFLENRNFPLEKIYLEYCKRLNVIIIMLLLLLLLFFHLLKKKLSKNCS